MSLKTENSRLVAKSRPVCMGLKAETHRTRLDKARDLSIFKSLLNKTANERKF